MTLNRRLARPATRLEPFVVVFSASAAGPVIEIDPAVTEVAYSGLGLWSDSRIKSYNVDARMKVPELPRGRYDLVIGDAFNDVSVPYHLTTREFNEQIRGLLTDDGAYVVNVVDAVWSGRFLRAFVNTLGQTFDYVAVIGTGEDWEFDSRTTTVVVGSQKPFLPSDLRTGAVRLGRADPAGHFMPQDVFDRWLNGRKRVLLTDDFAPVDQMLAPLYLKSR